MSHLQAVVWIDSHQARVIHFHPGASDELVLHSTHHCAGVQHDAAAGGGDRSASDERHHWDEVVRALAAAHEILVLGPADAKAHLIRHMQQHEQTLAERIVGVQPLSQDDDAHLLPLAHKYFRPDAGVALSAVDGRQMETP
jgi:hypothetical protein